LDREDSHQSLADDAGKTIPFPVPLDHLDPPDSIGPYRVRREIGAGSMGIVYEAEQTEPVKRAVAVKVIKVGMDTKEFVARFETERQALAVMDHPSIAKVYDAGTTELGRPYLVMELVHGAPITEYCDRHRLSTLQRLDLFVAVCEAIQHAHQKGVIHRDLKPSNILVTQLDAKPMVKVIDFGIAKTMGRRFTEQTLVTEPYRLMGTPLYMSPEQMAGSDTDTRADVYALGVMLYQLTTGSLPLDPALLPQDPVAFAALLTASEPARPSARYSSLGDERRSIAALRNTDPASLRSALKGDLDAIVMKAVDKDRTRRYSTVAGLGQDVERYVNHEPVTAAAPSAYYLARKFIRRHKAGVTAGAVVAVALIVGLVLATYGMVRAQRAEQAAASEAEAARQVSQFMVELFRIADPNEATAGQVTAKELLDRGAERIVAELADQPLIQARLMHTIGGVYVNLALYEPAERMLERAVAVTTAVRGPDHPEVAQSLNSLGALHVRQGRYAAADSAWRRALAIREHTLAPHDSALAESYSNLGVLYAMQGRLADAVPLFEQSLHIWERVLGPEHPNLAAGLNNLAIVYRSQGQYADAERAYRRALEIREREFGTQHLAITQVLNNLADLYADQGKYDEAAALFQRSLSIREATLEPDHPDIATSLQNLALLHFRRGNYAEAEPLFRRALAIRETALGQDHPQVATALNNLAVLHLEVGRYARAEPLMLRSLAIREQALGPTHPETALSLHNLARLRALQGRQAEAESLYHRALAVRESVLGPEHPAVAETLLGLAGLALSQQRYPAADSLFARAVSIRETALGAEHSSLVQPLNDHATVLRELGRTEESTRLEARASAIAARSR
jgi:tetratricopeptide (TPR) repeat protein